MYDFNEIKNVGLFIDGENINSKDIEFVIEEVKKFGRLIVNRVYGDWSTTLWNQWKQYCIKEGLEPKPILINRHGKVTSYDKFQRSFLCGKEHGGMNCKAKGSLNASLEGKHRP